MNGGASVALDADLFLELLDKLADLEKQLRSLGQKGFNTSGLVTGKLSPASREKKSEPDAMELDLDINSVEWKKSNRDGGGLAGPRDGWAWAFGFTQDGGVRRETMQLVQAIEM